MGSKTTIIAQEHQEGLGHAVYVAREWLEDEPFLLMLGDHIYRSNTSLPCAGQLLDIYEKYRKSVVGLRVTPESMIGRFGTVGGLWEDREGGLLSITEFAEKPSVEYARERLRVDGLGKKEYLSIFGLYVIAPKVLDILAGQIRENLRRKGEFELTGALESLRAEQGFLGALIDGERFDIGIPLSYLETVIEFSKKP